MKKLILILTYTFFIVAINAQQKGVSPLSTIPNSSLGAGNQQLSTKSTYAVVVGISDYQDAGIPDLKYADKDALAFANFLRSPGGGSLNDDHLKLLINKNATAGRLAEALDNLIELAKEGDKIFIYFSGHGDVEAKKISQPGFILCWDAPASVYMGGGTYSLAYLQEIVSTLTLQNKSKVFVIADACHAGKLAGSQIGGSQLTAANLAKQFSNDIKILSCQPGEFSLEGEQWGGGRGCFSYHLVDGLFGLADRNNNGMVSLGELDRYLEDKVSTEVAPQSQVPILLGNKTEHLATVNAQVVVELNQSKGKSIPVFSAIDQRGFESEIISKTDPIVQKQYWAFKKAVFEKRFFPTALSKEIKINSKDSITLSADELYQVLSKNPNLVPLYGIMKRNYAASLQDASQQELNEAMNSTSQFIRESWRTKVKKYQLFAPQLARAAELLGDKHYLYRPLLARKAYFEGRLIQLQNRQNERRLAENCLVKFREALHWQEDLPYVYLAIGQVYAYNYGRMDSAEYYTKYPIADYQKWLLPYLSLIDFYLDKDLDAAKEYLNMATRVDSTSAMVWFEWGIIHSALKDTLMAEASYKKAIALDSKNSILYTSLAILYLMTQREEEGLENLNLALQIDSTIGTHYNNLAAVSHDYKFREYYLRKAIEIDPGELIAYMNLSDLLTYLGKTDESEKVLLAALQLDSSWTDTYIKLGRCYTRAGRFTDAEKWLGRAYHMDTSKIHTQESWMEYYIRSGNLNQALTKAEALLQRNPTDETALIFLLRIHLNKGDYQRAQSLFESILLIHPTSIELNITMACSYAKQNRLDDAFYLLEKILKWNSIRHISNLQLDPELAVMRSHKKRWDPLMKKYFPEKEEKK